MRTNKKLILELKRTYCRLKSSKLHGIGVFAIRDIPEGTEPFREFYNEETFILTEKDIAELPKAVRNLITDFVVPTINGVYQIPTSGLQSLNVSWYINHSETPNMLSRDGWLFRAKRSIKAGEELTVDYRLYGAKIFGAT